MIKKWIQKIKNIFPTKDYFIYHAIIITYCKAREDYSEKEPLCLDIYKWAKNEAV